MSEQTTPDRTHQRIDAFTALRLNTEELKDAVSRSHPLYEVMRDTFNLLSEEFVQEFLDGSSQHRDTLVALQTRLLTEVKKPATFIDIPGDGLEVILDCFKAFAILLGALPEA